MRRNDPSYSGRDARRRLEVAMQKQSRYPSVAVCESPPCKGHRICRCEPHSPRSRRHQRFHARMIMEAKCQCGRLRVALPGLTPAVVACHCSYCQRRSGSPFGVLAYYPAETLKISGRATWYVRPTSSGEFFETYFCSTCGSTVYAKAGKHPSMLGVAVGAINDPTFPAPARSVWEEEKHDWVVIPEPVAHYPQGRS